VESLLTHEKKAEHFTESPGLEVVGNCRKWNQADWQNSYPLSRHLELGGASNPTRPAADALVVQIAGRVGDSAIADCGAPFIQLAVVHLPKYLQRGEALQDHLRLALFDEFPGEGEGGRPSPRMARRAALRAESLPGRKSR
jgi:hypothetical protein